MDDYFLFLLYLLLFVFFLKMYLRQCALQSFHLLLSFLDASQFFLQKCDLFMQFDDFSFCDRFLSHWRQIFAFSWRRWYLAVVQLVFDWSISRVDDKGARFLLALVVLCLLFSHIVLRDCFFDFRWQLVDDYHSWALLQGFAI